MNNYFFSLLAICLFPSQLIYAQLTIVVTDIPANTPADADIYIAGNFNNWSEGDANYILQKQNNDTYSIELMPSNGTVEFKFTRGSWTTVEGNASGGYQPNHSVQYNGSPLTHEVPILSWEDLAGGGNSTAADNVQILDTDFYIPQLDRHRRIWLYLPPDYATSTKKYPVLYMHDGQNLFDESTSFSGEWKVDESLNTLFDQGDYGIIVVGIDNGSGDRINEYSPWTFTYQGQTFGGEGAEYVDFIVETLKPHIDSNYRTLPQQKYCGIMGSSLGGLISHYAAIEYQDVFGKVGVFSPSYWVSDDAYTHTTNTGKTASMKFYMIAGQNESSSMVPDLLEMENTMLDVGFLDSEIMLLVHPDGAHSEWYWAREFPDAYEWLFGDLSVSTSLPIDNFKIQLHPNPAKQYLEILVDRFSTDTYIELYAMTGQLVLRHPLRHATTTMDISHLADSIYVVQIITNQEVKWSNKLIITK